MRCWWERAQTEVNGSTGGSGEQSGPIKERFSKIDDHRAEFYTEEAAKQGWCVGNYKPFAIIGVEGIGQGVVGCPGGQSS